MSREPIEPASIHRPVGHYTHAIRASGSLLFISGQVGLDAEGNPAGEGVGAQCEQIFKNLQAILEEAGASFADIVKLNYYITDMAAADAVRAVRVRYLGDTRPASTFVAVSALVDPRLLLEIEAVAVT
jgi:reactive intermediate/imine deaminase